LDKLVCILKNKKKIPKWQKRKEKPFRDFFAVFLGCGRRVEYATLVHKDIFEAAPVQRIWGLKKDTRKTVDNKADL